VVVKYGRSEGTDKRPWPPRSAAKSGMEQGYRCVDHRESVCSVQQTEKSSYEYSVLCPDTQPWTEASRPSRVGEGVLQTRADETRATRRCYKDTGVCIREAEQKEGGKRINGNGNKGKRPQRYADACQGEAEERPVRQLVCVLFLPCVI